MANIYGKLKAVTADGVLADAEQIEETATGKSVAVALKDLRRAVQGQIDPSVINVDAYTKKETDGKIEALSKKIVTVDPEISDTSENPVQNKAVKSYVDNMRVKVVTKLPDTGEDNLIYAVKKQSLKFIPKQIWRDGEIDFDRPYSLFEGRSGLDYYTYIADDGESFSVGDYLSDSLSKTLYEINGNGKSFVLIHNTADDTYISKEITAAPGQKPMITDPWRRPAFEIKSVVDTGVVIKVVDDVVPPVTAESSQKISTNGFILRKTTYVLYTYNSGKWQQLGAKFTSDLMDIDSLKTQLIGVIKRRETMVGLKENLEFNLDEDLAKTYNVTASKNLTMWLDGELYSLDVYIKNAASSEITVTIPNGYVSNTHSFKMAAGSYVAVTVCYSPDFSKYIVNIGSALG